MLSFQRIDENAIPALQRCFAMQPYRSCDYTASVTYMWRKYFHTEYATTKGLLYLRMCDKDGLCHYLLPAGEGDPISALKEVSPCGGVLRLSAVPEEMLSPLKAAYGENIAILEERRWADYLYDRESLAAYSGKKYAGQRNHVNKFLSHYQGYAQSPLTAATLSEFRSFLLSNKALLCKPTATALAEYDFALDMLDHALQLRCSGTLLSLPSGVPVGISIGSTIGDTYYVHIEKALHTIPGASQLLCRVSAENVSSAIKYINREDDMGDEGLRTAKMQLHPVMLVKKHTVIIPIIQ